MSGLFAKLAEKRIQWIAVNAPRSMADYVADQA